MEDFTIIKGIEIRPKAVKQYKDKQLKRYKDKQIETDHCIFITNKVFKQEFDPDPVRNYEPTGEHTKEKEEQDAIVSILKGVK
jgi:hypothetical protein